MPTLYAKMREAALKHTDKDAILFYGRRLKFNEMLDYVDRAAAGLKAAGVAKGGVVTVCMPNTPSAQIVFYAINRLGAIANLVHPFIPAAQLKTNIEKTKSGLLIAYDLYLAKNAPFDYGVPVYKSATNYFMGGLIKPLFKLANRKKLKDKSVIKAQPLEKLLKYPPLTDTPAEFGEDEPAVYLPSGGTSGNPKIIMHSCRVFNQLCGHAQYFLTDPIPKYKAVYTVLPIFHGYGLCMNMHMCALHGVLNVMCTKFDAKHMTGAIEKEKVGIVMGVPTMFQKLLKSKEFLRADLSSLKDCFVGGDTVPLKLIHDFNAALKAGGSTGSLYTGYGLTETVTVCTVSTSRRARMDSIGAPLPDTELRIMDGERQLAAGEVGEICVKTPLMMLGYLDGEENPVKKIDGGDWLYTGDLGYLSDDGFLFFKQRMKNMIKVSGIPVFPCEIEEVVEGIEGVVRAAAIAVDDESSGQAAKLFVQYKDADTGALRDKILTECKARLIGYAVPKYIEFRKELPLNTIGKIDRKELK